MAMLGTCLLILISKSSIRAVSVETAHYRSFPGTLYPVEKRETDTTTLKKRLSSREETYLQQFLNYLLVNWKATFDFLCECRKMNKKGVLALFFSFSKDHISLYKLQHISISMIIKIILIFMGDSLPSKCKYYWHFECIQYHRRIHRHKW